MHATRHLVLIALTLALLVSVPASSWAAAPWLEGSVEDLEINLNQPLRLGLSAADRELHGPTSDDAFERLIEALPARYGWQVTQDASNVGIPTLRAASVNPLARLGGGGLLALLVMCGLLAHGTFLPRARRRIVVLGQLGEALKEQLHSVDGLSSLLGLPGWCDPRIEALLDVPEPEHMVPLPTEDLAAVLSVDSGPEHALASIEEVAIAEDVLDPPESPLMLAATERSDLNSLVASSGSTVVVDEVLLDAPSALTLEAEVAPSTPTLRPTKPILSLDEAMSAAPSSVRPELVQGANHGPEGPWLLAANHAQPSGLYKAANHAPSANDVPTTRRAGGSGAASLVQRHRQSKRAAFAHGAAAAHGAVVAEPKATTLQIRPLQSAAHRSSLGASSRPMPVRRRAPSPRVLRAEAPTGAANHVPIAVLPSHADLSPEEMLSNIPWWLEGATDEDHARLALRKASDEQSQALDRVCDLWGARDLPAPKVAETDAPAAALPGSTRPKRRGYAALAALLSPGMILLATLLVPALLGFDVASAADGADAALRLELGGEGAGQSTTAVKLLVILTLLAVAPAIVLSMTSFTRLIVVFSLLRQAIGVQQAPPNQILVGLALFLTWFVMAPTFTQVNELAVQPYFEGQMNELEAVDAALGPMREFMLRNTRPSDLGLFLKLNRQAKPASPADIPTPVLVPAFIISELKTAFSVGFLIYIPFLIIDIVVSTILLAMGMMVLPPVVISMPFKLLLFVFVDGWNLLVGSMVSSFV